MHTGMLVQLRKVKGSSLQQKIETMMAYYEKMYGTKPTVFFYPTPLKEEVKNLPKTLVIERVEYPAYKKGWIWFGVSAVRPDIFPSI